MNEIIPYNRPPIFDTDQSQIENAGHRTQVQLPPLERAAFYKINALAMVKNLKIAGRYDKAALWEAECRAWEEREDALR